MFIRKGKKMSILSTYSPLSRSPRKTRSSGHTELGQGLYRCGMETSQRRWRSSNRKVYNPNERQRDEKLGRLHDCAWRKKHRPSDRRARRPRI